MPLPFQGNTNVTVTSPVYNLPFKVTFFTIANLYAGTTTITVSVTDGATDFLITPQNLELSEGNMVEGTLNEAIMEAGNQVKIATDQLVSYFFTIENIKPD